MTRALAVQGDVSREADVSRLFAAVDGALGTVAVLVNSACAAHAVRRMSTARGGAGGSIATDIHASGGDPERAQRLAPSLPMQRAGSPQEVARAISWLASDAASYCTGAILDVSGGR